jgi:hypothetical protein
LAHAILGDVNDAIQGGTVGALGGLLAGIVGGIANGVVLGATPKRITVGCMVGIVFGVAFGALWGARGPFTRIGLAMRPIFAAIGNGGIIGAVTTWLLGSFTGAGFGAAAGAFGSAVWALLCAKVEAGEVKPKRFELDEDLSSYYDQRVRRRTLDPYSE